jgi:methylmalonyl-CoA mutase cobalamin-binding subunit
MASQSILDHAAEVREKARRVKELCDEMRRAGKPWVGAEIAHEDAQEIARAGLRNAWTMLDRIQQILVEVRDHKPTPEGER